MPITRFGRSAGLDPCAGIPPLAPVVRSVTTRECPGTWDHYPGPDATHGNAEVPRFFISLTREVTLRLGYKKCELILAHTRD